MKTLSVLASLFVVLTLAHAEPKATALLNGKDLTGWKTKEGDKLDAKTEAYAGRFKVVDGELVIDPTVKGDKYIYTQADYAGDITISFEFKPGEKCNNDLFVRGAKFDIKEGGELKAMKMNDWNKFEIVVTGKKVEYKLNGTSIKTLNAKDEKSNFGLRAEFGHIRYKNVTMSK